MATFDNLLCLEQTCDGNNDDRDDVEVLQATLRSLQNLPLPVEHRLVGCSDNECPKGTLTGVAPPWCRQPVLCRTLNGNNDRRVLDNLLAVDAKYRDNDRPVNYFEAGVQPDIQPYMRDMVTGWMLEVCEVERCTDEVFPLAVSYLDRFLATPAVATSSSSSHCSLPPLRRSQLQLVAAACMFISSKYRDTAPIPSTQLVMYTDFSVTLDQLLECELMVLQAIQWDLSMPTPHDYFDHLLKRFPLTSEQRISVRRHAHTFAAMCITDATFLGCTTTIMAVACVSAALSGLKGRRWCSQDEVDVMTKLQEMTYIEAACIKSWQNKIEQLLNNYHVGSSSPGQVANSTQVAAAGTSGDVEGAEVKLNVVGGTVDENNGCFQRKLSTPADVREICLID